MKSSPELKTGIINAITAYTLWGLAPIYFQWLNTIAPFEILMHRIIWSCLFLVIIVLTFNQWPKVRQVLKSPSTAVKLTGTAILLGINWFVFIWAVTNKHILDASLGYYINPLFSIALGMIFLGERLRRWQLVAVFLALTGVLVQVVTLGSVPIVSLILAGSFGLYGLFRKQLAVDSLPGLLIESFAMLPLALIYWIFWLQSDTSNLLLNSPNTNLLLLAAGIVTTAPLICFTVAAKRLTLASLGFFQYIGPSLMFFIATFYFEEPLVAEKLITFAFIWAALALYSFDTYKAKKQTKPEKILS